jgi:hypothetical protein
MDGAVYSPVRFEHIPTKPVFTSVYGESKYGRLGRCGYQLPGIEALQAEDQHH